MINRLMVGGSENQPTPEKRFAFSKYKYPLAFTIIFGALIGAILICIYPTDIYTINNNQNDKGEPCVVDHSGDFLELGTYRNCGIQVKEPVVIGQTVNVFSDFCAQASGTAKITYIYTEKENGRRVALYEITAPFAKGYCTPKPPAGENLKPGGGFEVPPELKADKEYYIRFISEMPTNPLREIFNPLKKETQTLSFKPVPAE